MNASVQTLAYPKFTPGSGVAPPYLAGREAEQRLFRERLADLCRGERSESDIVVIGPRGNGKTVLMRWFERQCERTETLDAVWLTPNDIRNDLDILATGLAPPSRWQALLPDEIRAGFSIVDFKWNLGDQPASLSRLLTARCRQRPLALLLDEAHTLELSLGRTLLNSSQEVRAKAPFLLVLGGTPGLEQQMNRMGATFWSRSQLLGIGRLDENGAREALVRPFTEHGIVVDEAVLEPVITESQSYPYFLQCWGKALADGLREQESDSGAPLRRIDASTLELAHPAFEEKRVAHYALFRNQIREAGLQALAAAVTRAFQGADTLEEHELDRAVMAHLQAGRALDVEPDAAEIVAHQQALARFGYIWRPPTCADVWHAGVPSLLRHVLEIQQKREALV